MVLLVGDLAHIHSPIGGQGMPLGIRDAISLGRALKLQLDSDSGAASESLLEEWAVSWRECALEVIKLTKRTMRVITAQTNIWAPLTPRLRRSAFALLRFASGFKWVQRSVAYEISGLAEI
ncbi:hypothetical protein B0H16DRAFT_1572322 [Mycena metata]|uniref:FAD-binding domain-containing protein n=1 Tax=Mycena metata TaxID=1033252 RepID=A0AAD7IA34_9AGAR|nr:hypothetical protein B0H16DRAFT_1572322 [Mycena metata]